MQKNEAKHDTTLDTNYFFGLTMLTSLRFLRRVCPRSRVDNFTFRSSVLTAAEAAVLAFTEFAQKKAREKQLLTDAFLFTLASRQPYDCVSRYTPGDLFWCVGWVGLSIYNSTACAFCMPPSPNRVATSRLSQVHCVSCASLRERISGRGLGSGPRMSSQSPPRAARVSALEVCTVCTSLFGNAQHKVTGATVVP